MAIKACFIGIDKYQDPSIRDLAGAKRDATALWALFSDTMPDLEAEKFVDEEATLENIRKVLDAKLGSAGTDDVVIISFSGHGTHNHRIVAHNTVYKVLNDTTIPMEEIAARFKDSRAKVIFFILDCCFSGAAPARVLDDSPVPRDIEFHIENLVAGKGRLLLAAARDDQRAYEIPSKGHGLLTKVLIEVLQSGEGRVNLSSAVDRIMQLVRAEAERLGFEQTPVCLDFVEGGLTFPVLKPGRRFYEAFPETKGIQITNAIADLSSFRIPQPILDEWSSRFKNGLNKIQLEAVNKYRILDGQSLLVVAPTSSGKTFLGEMASARAIVEGKKAVFLLPYKALVNEKYDYFMQLYNEKLGIRVIRCTGDHSDQTEPFVKGKYDIALLTFEMFLNLLVSNSSLLLQIGLVVLDEAQFVTNPTRGMNVELLLTFLLASREKEIVPQLIALSAVIGNVNDFDQWLNVEALISNERPVPLIEGVLDRSGVFQYVDESGAPKISQLLPGHSIEMRRDKPSSQDIIVPLVKNLIRENPEEQVIIFRNKKGLAQGCAGYLAKELGLPPATEVIAQLPNHDLSTSSSALRECLSGGTAFHNTNLNRLEKAIIERAFRDLKNKVRVLGATTTMAAGINTPASTVILAETEFMDEEGPIPFTIAEYKNMAGRAGRLGYNEKGKAILLAETSYERERLFNLYVRGTPEAMASSFDPRHIETWIVRLLAQIDKIPRPAVTRLLANTYGGYLANRGNPGWADQMKRELEVLLLRMISLGLVEQEGDFIRLSLLGRACGRSALSLDSAMRLVDLLKTTHLERISAIDLMAIVQILPEMDGFYTPLMKRAHKEQEWPGEVRRRYGADIASLLQRHARENPDYWARCKRAGILLDWIEGSPAEAIERKYSATPYQGKIEYGNISGIADASRFYLRSAYEIAAIVLIDKAPSSESFEGLLRQLEAGIPVGALGLLRIPIPMIRGEYLALFQENIKTLKDFLLLSIDSLKRIFGVPRFEEVEKMRSKIQGMSVAEG